MSETQPLLPERKTALVLQISPTETTSYTMPWATYELVVDVMEIWNLFYSRRDKCTVEKILGMMEKFSPSVREGIVVKREPTKSEIRGLSASMVYVDDFGFYEEEAK